MKTFVKYSFAFVLSCVGCSASTTKSELGEVVHKTVTCDEPVKCKLEMINQCKKGASIHKISPALHVEYSCNDS